jgi:hypothetical protein
MENKQRQQDNNPNQRGHPTGKAEGHNQVMRHEGRASALILRVGVLSHAK